MGHMTNRGAEWLVCHWVGDGAWRFGFRPCVVLGLSMITWWRLPFMLRCSSLTPILSVEFWMDSVLILVALTTNSLPCSLTSAPLRLLFLEPLRRQCQPYPLYVTNRAWRITSHLRICTLSVGFCRVRNHNSSCWMIWKSTQWYGDEAR